MADFAFKPPKGGPDWADKLHDYMQFRAKLEGQEYGLHPDFYRSLPKGTTTFFGVGVDKNNHRLTHDKQNSTAWAKYNKPRAT